MRVDRKSMIVLCGVAGSGKSTFAEKNFSATEIVSSDRCRAMVSDDEGNMAVSREAFDIFYSIIEKRMKSKRLVVADSTALTYDSRKRLIGIARKYEYHTVIIAFDVPLSVILERNGSRERKVPNEIIERQYSMFKIALKCIHGEDFDEVHILKDEDIPSFNIDIAGDENSLPAGSQFDIVSDIHGCCDELEMLLEKLGYERSGSLYKHPAGRKLIFAGDIVDRGPRSIDAINIAAGMVSSGDALYIPGDHCNKFYRYLKDKKVHIRNGLETTVREYENMDRASRDNVKEKFIKLYESSPLYLVLDGGKLVVAHAGIMDSMIGKSSQKIEDFVLQGSKKDDDDVDFWFNSHQGESLIVYGHTPVPKSEFVNNTINIDQGASCGGSLAALRYPEMEIVSVKSADLYYRGEKSRKAGTPCLNYDDYNDALYIKIDDEEKVKIEHNEVESSILEIKSIADDGRWVVYLPAVIPSINSHDIYSQSEAALSYYKYMGKRKIIIECRDIYSQYVFIICKSEDVSRKYFNSDEKGEIYSQYSPQLKSKKHEIIDNIHSHFASSGFFYEHNTEFIVFEGIISGEMAVIPVKIICSSNNVLYNKDSIWQMENIDKLSKYSNMLKSIQSYVIDTGDGSRAFIKRLIDQGLEEFIIKPVDSLSGHRRKAVQPAILCSSKNILAGEGFFELSAISNLFTAAAVDRFIKDKLSNSHFQYVIGTAAINNRINRRV